MLKSFFHWKVWLNIILAISVFVGLVWLTFRWLEYHTNHGKETPVPNVVNMSVHKAIEVLEDAGLKYEVDSFNYNPKYKPFQVLQIYPNAGAKVKDGRAILLKVNPRTWAPVQVPDILDKYKGLAFRQLEAVGLHIGDTIYEPNIQRDAVIRMQMNGNIIKPGMLLPRFSSIDLVIGTGPKRNVTVPNLVGLTVQQAKAVITENLFEVGIVEYEDGIEDETAIVYYQDPEGGAIRDQGMQIDLWASKKTPAQMYNKIQELNSIYRMQIKIDTTLPPLRYEEVPVYHEPMPVPEPVREEPKKTPTAPPKNTETKTQEKVEQKKTTTSETKPANVEKPKTEEKPKVKKVIVE